MNVIREYVDKLSNEQMRAILYDWQVFERDGAIGDCALRFHAMRCLGEHQSSAVILLMREVAFECYRHYAMLYFDAESAAQDYPI